MLEQPDSKDKRIAELESEVSLKQLRKCRVQNRSAPTSGAEIGCLEGKMSVDGDLLSTKLSWDANDQS